MWEAIAYYFLPNGLYLTAPFLSSTRLLWQPGTLGFPDAWCELQADTAVKGIYWFGIDGAQRSEESRLGVLKYLITVNQHLLAFCLCSLYCKNLKIFCVVPSLLTKVSPYISLHKIPVCALSRSLSKQRSPSERACEPHLTWLKVGCLSLMYLKIEQWLLSKDIFLQICIISHKRIWVILSIGLGDQSLEFYT